MAKEMFQRSAETKRSRSRPVTAPQTQHVYRTVFVTDFSGRERIMTFERAKGIGKKRTSGLPGLRRGRREKRAARAAAAEHRRIAYQLLIEELEAERRNRALWRPVRVRDPLPKPKRQEKKSREMFIRSSTALPKYSGPIVDRMGTRGIFLRVRYWGAKRTRAGVASRGVNYIWLGALEAGDGQIFFKSNVAEDVGEAMAAFDLIEQVNRAGADYAKVAFHLISNVPHDLPAEKMMAIGLEFAEEQFGARGLPYAVALHPPSPEGDERNWHLHIVFSTRPLIRVDDHAWEVGDHLRTDIDNDEAFRRMRELYAEVQTDIVQAAGLNYRYTALSNASRGLPIAPQEHLGPVRTAPARRGDTVAANERNWERSIAGEAALLDEQLRHAEEAAKREAAILATAKARASRFPTTGERQPLALSTAIPAPSATGALSNRLRLSRIETVAVDTRPVPTAISNLKRLSEAQPARATHVRFKLPSGGDAPVMASTGQPSGSLPSDPVPLTPPSRLSGIARASRARVSNLKPPLTLHVPLPSHGISASASVRLARQPLPQRNALPGLNRVPLSATLPQPTSRPVAAVSPLRLHFAPGLLRGMERSVDASPAMSRSLQLKPAVVEPARLSTVIPATVHDHQWDALLRRAERLKREADRKAKDASAQKQKVVAQLDAAIESLRRLDPWIISPAEGEIFSVGKPALAFLGRDRSWMESKPVQRALLDITLEQQAVVDSIIPHLCWREDRLTLEQADPALQRRVRSWSSEPDFIGYVEALRPELRDQREETKRDAARSAQMQIPSKAEGDKPAVTLPPWMRGQGPGLGG